MEKNKKMFILFLVGFVIGIVGFTGSFFMYLKANENKGDTINYGDKKDIITNGIVFNSIDETVHLDRAIPTLDKFGVEEKGFNFSIKNTTNEEKKYQLSLADDNSTIKNSFIRYQLIKNNVVLGIFTLSEDGILEKGVINPSEEINYTIKIWLDYNSDVKVGRLSKKIAVAEIIDEEAKVIVNEPILTNGMIPVYYDINTNSWYKSDGKNTYNSTWYNYEEQNWANVVTVDSEKREYYETSAVGTRILPEDINSMWVWIPRFNVEIKNNDININFVSKDKEAYSAFTFNNQELDGIWFAKFESGMKEDSECISLSLTKKCNDSTNTLYFVPNYPFATKMTMANMFYSIRRMELKNNIYGFNGTGDKVNNDGTIKNDTNDIDIHMIKNTEWQAVALLSSSKYGKTGNIKYDSKNKVIINNSSNYTGKAYVENIDVDYNVLGKGEGASTTGNITGIYDMSGGKREYVMIDNEEINIFDKKSNSGFSNKVKEYYYDNGFNDSDATLLLKEKYGKDNLINNEPVTRGGYISVGNIFNLYSASDYLDKISVETNSRACLVVLKEN